MLLADIVNVIKATTEIFREKRLLAIVSTVLAMSFFLFVFIEILPQLDIILPMMNIIKGCIIWILLISLSFVMASALVNYFTRILVVRQDKISKRKAEQEAQEEQTRETAELVKYINSLSGQQKKIFDVIAENYPCGTWVANDSAEVLTLLHRGIFLKLSDREIWADWEFAEPEWDGQKVCILVTMPDSLANELKGLA